MAAAAALLPSGPALRWALLPLVANVGLGSALHMTTWPFTSAALPSPAGALEAGALEAANPEVYQDIRERTREAIQALEDGQVEEARDVFGELQEIQRQFLMELLEPCRDALRHQRREGDHLDPFIWFCFRYDKFETHFGKLAELLAKLESDDQHHTEVEEPESRTEALSHWIHKHQKKQRKALGKVIPKQIKSLTKRKSKINKASEDSDDSSTEFRQIDDQALGKATPKQSKSLPRRMYRRKASDDSSDSGSERGGLEASERTVEKLVLSVGGEAKAGVLEQVRRQIEALKDETYAELFEEAFDLLDPERSEEE